MFCGECGTKNEKGAQFCEKCGSKLEVEETVVAKPVAPKKPMSKKTKIIIGVVAVLVVAFIGAYMYIGSLFTPEKMALKYFKAYTSNDADTLYEIMDLDESKFVTKKLLKESLKENEDIKVANYNVEGKETNEDSLSTTVTITYVVEGSSKEKEKTVKLVKNKDKKWLFFDNWTVDSSDLIANDYVVIAPADSEVQIGGITIPEKYKEDYYLTTSDKYIIPSILKGKYDVTIKYESGIELVSDMTVSYSEGTSRINNLNLTEKLEKNLIKDIKEKLELLYKSAIDEKSFDDIKDSFSEDLQGEIEDEYNYLKSNANSDYRNLKEVNITEIKISSITVDDGELKLYLSMKYNYKLDYKDGDETKEYTSKDKTDSFYAYYTIDEKEYVMSNLTYFETYFSRY